MVNVLGAIAFLLIAATGLGSYWSGDGVMAGDRLLTHVAMAPLFLIGAVMIAIYWADRSRFAAADNWLLRLRKISFWAAVVLVAPAVLSILLAMFPIAQPAQQKQLFDLHRTTAMAFSIAAMLFALLALICWMRERPRP